MAEWLYEIQRMHSTTDSQFEHFLQEQGENGWELVQVLPATGTSDRTEYQVIFKREKPLISGQQ